MNLDLVKLGKAASAMLLAAAMAGCGGSGPTLIVPPTAVDLDGSMDLTPGVITLLAGTSMTVGNTELSCSMDEDCELTVSRAQVTGQLMATSTGGTVTVMVTPDPVPTSLPLPAGHELMAGTSTIAAGDSMMAGRTTVSCPSGGDACELIVAADEVTGALVAGYFGGMPMVTVAMPASLALPAGHELMAGTVTIMAGGSTEHGRTTVTCPSDGEACELILEQSPAGLVASYLGGMPTVMVDTPTSLTLPAGHELVAGMVIMMAGESAEHGRTTVTCPSDGEACEFIVEQSPTGVLMASYFGGMPTVMVDTPTSLTLPPGHQLMPGTTHIKAGGSSMVGRTTVTCPSGGEACELIVTRESSTGALMAEYYGGTPMVDVAPHGVRLPMEHSLVAGMFMVKAGETETMGGVDFMCPAGGMDCIITITADGMASSAGGEATAMQVDPRGYQAFKGLSDTILDRMKLSELQSNQYHRGLRERAAGVTSSVTTHETFVPGSDPNVRGVSDIEVKVEVEQLSGPGTARLDVIEPMFGPTNGRPYPFNSPGSRSRMHTPLPSTYPNPPGNYEYPNGPGMYMLTVSGPVRVEDDGITSRELAGDIRAFAGWARNSSAAWEAPEQPSRWLGLIGAGADNLVDSDMVDWDMADDRRRLAGRDQPEDIWTHYFQWVDSELPGGRTLELDLRSDYVPGHANFWQPTTDEHPRYPIVARGAGGAFDEVTVPWNDPVTGAPNIRGDWNGDGRIEQQLPSSGEEDVSFVEIGTVSGEEVAIDMSGDMGVEGSYQGVRGRFVCIDGGAAGGGPLTTALPFDNGPTSGTNQGRGGPGNGTGNGVCEVENQAGGRSLGVSEDDLLVFVPYVHGADPNWLAAGVWLTLPHDLRQGDYAIGVFVYGNDPVRTNVAMESQLAPGSATYRGQAFGRYVEDTAAEATEEDGTGAMTTGRFTADAVLTARFDDPNSPNRQFDNPGLDQQPNDPMTGRPISTLMFGFGEIEGTLTGFETDGGDGVFESRGIGWDVDLELADIHVPMWWDMNDSTWRPVDGRRELRFNAPAGGHAGTAVDSRGGHALTGYWNGLFYGDPNNSANDDNPLVVGIQDPWMGQPGNAAGTFALTSEREDGGVGDDYSLTMQGAFATYWQP